LILETSRIVDPNSKNNNEFEIITRKKIKYIS
jgi:hypothetical protein